jgi:hypothetical protein
MGRTTFSGPVRSTNGFIAGSSGTQITGIFKGTVSVNPSSLTTGTGELLSVTLTGAVVGDAISIHPPAAGLTTGLVIGQAYVSAADTVIIQIWNPTAGTINEGAADWIYVLIRS